MKNKWIVIEVKVRGELVDLVGAILSEHGCAGTIVEERVLDTFSFPDHHLNLSADYTLKAYFDGVADSRQLVFRLKLAFDEIPLFRKDNIVIKAAASVQTEDWAEGWKQNFCTFHIGKQLVVRPSWENYNPTSEEVVIEIDPGMAFGTGTHGTTRLCLEMIAELLARTDHPVNMLDVGTGSGILALGAAALGCKKIVATDIDPVACLVARENVDRNNFSAQIEIVEQNPELIPGTFDLLVANIMAEVIVELKHTLTEHLHSGSWLVLSGILKEKEQLVSTAFIELPVELVSRSYQDEWVCLLFRRQD